MEGCLDVKKYGGSKKGKYFDAQAFADSRELLLYEFRNVQTEFSERHITLFANITTSFFHYLGYSNEWIATVKELPTNERESTRKHYGGKKYPEKLRFLREEVELFVDETRFSYSGDVPHSIENMILGLALCFDAFFNSLDEFKLTQWKTAVEACATYLDRRR